MKNSKNKTTDAPHRPKLSTPVVAPTIEVDKSILSASLEEIKEEIMQISVRDILALLPDAKEIYLVWDGSVVQRSPFSVLDMDAYGDYVVGSICPGEEKSIEIVLAAQPVKVCPGARA